MKCILFITVLLSLSFVKKSDQTSIQLEVYGVTNTKGNLMIAVYKDASHFPEFGAGDINIVHEVSSTDPVIEISALEIGKTYAIAVFHDENANKYLDKNFLGMPQEKYGFSNGARGTFGPPYFKEASFKVSSQQKLTITIR